MNEFEGRLTQEEEREAERFAIALDALDMGRSLDVEPADAPELYEDLRVASRLRASAEQTMPRAAYRVRSRALLIDSAAPLARRRAQQTPVIGRTSFLVPFASAAVAAGLTIAAVLGATALGYGPGGKAGTEATAATAANLTRRSIQEDLRSLEATVDAVVAAANRGEEVNPAMLRSIANATLSVTTLIETSPESVRHEDVISFFQTTASNHIRLGEIAPRVAATHALGMALGTAQSASENAVLASSRRLQAIGEELASGQRSQ
ncbi:MAG: hypothetical protein EXR66_04825 [Dehalococcoidia bacterium]|nr:hypothetical protein [Dehalococcoidia bacterium]